MAVILIAGLSGCSSAEKYKKRADENTGEGVAGEFALQIPADQQEWLRGLTEQLAAAQLASDLGDTAQAVRFADSLLRVAESVVDTISFGDPIQKFLLLFIADGYGKIMLWEKDPEVRAALTRRHEDLAARLQRRHDSLETTP